MSAKELRALIERAGMTSADCIEMAHVRARAREAETVDLTGGDDDALEPAVKRARPLAADSGALDLGALRREREARRERADPPAPTLPFRLLRARGEGDDARAHTTTLEELTAGRWRWAIFSNYLICPAWLESACASLMSCPLVVLARDEIVSRWAAAQGGRVHVVEPPLPDRYGTNHSKFIVLFNEAGMRLVVHTANALYHDARDMTQGIWSQDFPRRPAGAPRPAPSALGQLGGALHAYLARAIRAPVDLGVLDGTPTIGGADALLDFDFGAAGAHLLASVPGRHVGAEMARWGHVQLARLLRAEPALAAPLGQSSATASEVCAHDELVLQFSSFASIDKAGAMHGAGAYLAELCDAMSCSPAAAQLPARRLRAHIVWPLVDEVRQCHIGYDGGDSIPSNDGDMAKVSGSAALRGCLRRWATAGHALGRQRVTPHIKSYLRFDPTSKRVAWVALTSANVSRAAWCARRARAPRVPRAACQPADSRALRARAPPPSCRAPPPAAAARACSRGILEKHGQQLFIKSYELGVLITPSTLANARAHSPFDCQACTLGGAAGDTRAAAASPQAAPGAVAMVPMHEGASEERARALLAAGAAPLPLPYALLPPAYGPHDEPWVASVKLPGSGQNVRKVHALPDAWGRSTGNAQLYGRDKDGRSVV